MLKIVNAAIFVFLLTLNFSPTKAFADGNLTISFEKLRDVSGTCDLYFSMSNGTSYFFEMAAFDVSALGVDGQFLGDNLLYSRNLRSLGEARADIFLSNVSCWEIYTLEITPSDGLIVKLDGSDEFPFYNNDAALAEFREKFNSNVTVDSAIVAMDIVWVYR
jgi:hypothetical protein